jgi:hypothetical protein
VTACFRVSYSRIAQRCIKIAFNVPRSDLAIDRATQLQESLFLLQDELSKSENAGGFQEKFKNQAGKIRSRLRSIHRPSFSMPQSRSKPTDATLTAMGSGSNPPSSPRTDQKASRMERFRMALPERPRFSLPDKSKFHLPDRPKFNLPDKSKFHIKKPNIQLPKSLTRPRRSASERISQVMRLCLNLTQYQFTCHGY